MKSALPIKALLVFDAVMKHQSLTLAASDLHVTPGAVGQQIQKLEDWVGVPLFIRTVRQLHPTAEALKYWASIKPALARIQQASDQLRLSHVNEVWLSMPPTLAAKWFAPRMEGFLSQYPGASLHLSADTALIDFERDRVDLAIRYFDGHDPTLDVTLLYSDEARLYCSPEYARKLRLKKPEDLVRATLLHTTLQPHWQSWFHRFSQLTDKQIAAIPGQQHFDQSLLAIETARHGQGVVLSSAILTETEIRDGTLFEPFKLPLSVGKGYYVVHAKGADLRPATAKLKSWLLSLRIQEDG
ncbi:LysR substrate-binding domain-containing protein [Diaphorobacter caeni]|uniref:LysR substrate-binding domain-containing protein n=1 Tax=Diaphorobacter caeni TaxID=2784387 RepID=UPI00188E6A43|nr:LysR substrate-binding domain-containing protein [Diaphorobacter caeni]MBF5005729.1 LysR family transcriptional regulator [Diaphorobacter caeni]